MTSSEFGKQELLSDEVVKRTNHAPMRACSVCCKKGPPDLFFKCSSCSAVFYCSTSCQEVDWQQTAMEAYAHKVWCSKMKEYMSKEEELSQFPFSFTKETTSGEFSDDMYKQFLISRNLYNKGLWKRENIERMKTGCCIEYGEIDDPELYVLPECNNFESAQNVLCDAQHPLTTWQQYYHWRKLGMDSPAAIILHYPLTLYYILTSKLKTDYPHHNIPSLYKPGTEINIDCVGVEKELDILLTFQELGNLIHGVKINLRMIGKEISKKVHNKTVTYGSITITIYRKLYHKFDQTSPDMVVGFNAGLGAYGTWSDTLKKLKEKNIPAYFTDYCQYSCELANSAMAGLNLGQISDLTINPFRKPVRKFSEEMCMPWYSNGFIFHLQYT